jgi:hypothetical protein
MEGEREGRKEGTKEGRNFLFGHLACYRGKMRCGRRCRTSEADRSSQ